MQTISCWQQTRPQPPPPRHLLFHAFHAISISISIRVPPPSWSSRLPNLSFVQAPVHAPRVCPGRCVHGVHSHCNQYSSPPADTPASQRQKSYTATQSCLARATHAISSRRVTCWGKGNISISIQLVMFRLAQANKASGLSVSVESSEESRRKTRHPYVSEAVPCFSPCECVADMQFR